MTGSMEMLRQYHRSEAVQCIMRFTMLIAVGVLLCIATPLNPYLRTTFLGGVAYLLLHVLKPLLNRKLSEECEEEKEALPTALKASKVVKKKKSSKAKSQDPQQLPIVALAESKAAPAEEGSTAEARNERIEKLLAKKAQRKAA